MQSVIVMCRCLSRFVLRMVVSDIGVCELCAGVSCCALRCCRAHAELYLDWRCCDWSACLCCYALLFVICASCVDTRFVCCPAMLLCPRLSVLYFDVLNCML